MPLLHVSDDVEIAYETCGDAEAPAVVLLHGFTSDLRMWQPHIEPLSRDYLVVAIDLRGHGQSSAPEDTDTYTMEAYATDVAAVLDSLGLAVCALVGCSFGGMVALQFATTWPERVAALVISDASPAYEHPRYDDAFREREARIAGMGDVVNRFGTAELGKRASAGISEEFLAEGVRQRYQAMSAAGIIGAIHARQVRPNLLPVLRERLTMPVLLLAGEKDPVRVATELMADDLPGASYLMFRGAGHGVPSIRPDAFQAEVLGFFGAVEDGTLTPVRRTV